MGLESVRKCLSCGKPTPEGPACKSCGAPMRGYTPPQHKAPARQPPRTAAATRLTAPGGHGAQLGQRNPAPPIAVVGAILNLFLPGLGHLVQGRIVGAIIFFVGTIFGYAAFVLPGLGMHVLSVISAARYRPNQPIRAGAR